LASTQAAGPVGIPEEKRGSPFVTILADNPIGTRGYPRLYAFTAKHIDPRLQRLAHVAHGPHLARLGFAWQFAGTARALPWLRAWTSQCCGRRRSAGAAICGLPWRVAPTGLAVGPAVGMGAAVARNVRIAAVWNYPRQNYPFLLEHFAGCSRALAAYADKVKMSYLWKKYI